MLGAAGYRSWAGGIVATCHAAELDTSKSATRLPAAVQVGCHRHSFGHLGEFGEAYSIEKRYGPRHTLQIKSIAPRQPPIAGTQFTCPFP